MFKLTFSAEIEGHKPTIYSLKDQLQELLSGYSGRYDITITDNSGFQETISASIQSAEIKVDDIIDLTLSGDEMYELLEHKEEKIG